MIYCFDMDGTLTASPKVLGGIMKSLKKDGHTVYILTGSLGETEDKNLEEYRLNQAKLLGLERDWFDDIVSCVYPSFEGVAELKGKFCKNYKVDFLIDDMALYIQAVKANSPNTLTVTMV